MVNYIIDDRARALITGVETMTKRLLRAFFAVALVAGVYSSTPAATVPLSDLLDGGEFTSGDNVFTDFTYSKNGDMPAADGINVIDISDDDGNFGIRFNGSFIDSAGGNASDGLITFNVSVPDDVNREIVGVNLLANPAVFNGPGLASVTETFVPTIPDDKLVIYDFGGGDDKLVDSIVLSGYKTLPVQKDIILHAMGDGAVTMSFIDQTFVQVPEPAGLALILASFAGIGLLRRRK